MNGIYIVILKHTFNIINQKAFYEKIIISFHSFYAININGSNRKYESES